MWRRAFLIIFLSVAAMSQASADDRPFPAPTKRGKMSPAPFPEIVIDGKLRRLSPGARIWNQDNLIEMATAIRGSDLVVNYTENFQGDIDRVWILTPEEANKPVAKQINPMQQ
ncbi:hypothetical protein EGT07_16905 [Herbaspirillum sp. HC18]|nr:hypothetical protein EGT07_16905 [Herbaspirillum sp. HC18]